MNGAYTEKPKCGSNPDMTCGGDSSLAHDIAIGVVVGTIVLLVAILVSSLGIATLTAIFISLASVAGYVATISWVYRSYWARCIYEPARSEKCSAGVINEVVPSFSSFGEFIFPFTAMHDRVDVVVKSKYWRFIRNECFVECNGAGSPIIQCFYKSAEVCAAGLGSVIGAIAGGLAGIVLGTFVGMALMASCAILLLLCLLLALLLAALIAAACALIGAFIGGHIARGIAGASPPPADENSRVLRTGNYVTTTGVLTSDSIVSSKRAMVYWFVEHTYLEGHSSGHPPFSFTDPDSNYIPDACPERK